LGLPNGKITPDGAFACGGKTDTALLNFGNVKSLCLFRFMRQKNSWNCFSFSNIPLVKGKRVPAVLLPLEAK